MTPYTEPPRIARWLLSHALPRNVRDDVTGDLEEVFRRLCASQGVLRARLWYWRQSVSFTGRFVSERLHERRRPSREVADAEASRAIPRRQRGGGLSWLDIKLGVRMLIKYPGLTVVGALGITVAVGLAAAWFEFSRDIMTPRLPFEDGERIVRIQNWDMATAAPEPKSLHDFVTWRSELVSIEDLGAASSLDYRVGIEGGQSESVRGARITASAFRMLRVSPLLGRPLVESDEEPGAPPAVVIGHDVWQRLFDGDRSVLGKTVRLGNSTSTVVGVMPEGFGFPVNHELWVPFRYNALDYARREGPAILMFGRLAPGFTRREAQAELTAIGVRAAADFTATNERLRPRIGSIGDLGDEAVFAAGVNVIFILIMVVICANIATLVFARTATREGEIVLRTALGASRRRIVLQLFTEALVLTSVAAAIGLAAAAWGLGWGMDLFWDVQQTRPPFWFDDSLSFSTALYVAALALLSAAIIGVVPALKATGRRLRPRLSEVSGGSRLRFGAVSTGVIVIQVALCVAFLPVAIMRGQDLVPDRAARTGRAGIGFPADEFLSGQLTRQLDAPLSELPRAAREALFARTAEFQDEVRRRLAAEPGVSSVTFADRIPGFNHPQEHIRIEGDAVPPDSAIDDAVRTLAVDLDFFDTMNAPIVAGRAFGPADLESEVGVVIISESYARDLLKGRNAVGQRLRYPDRRDAEANRWHQIVGVVRDPAMVSFGPGEFVGLYRPLAPGREFSVQMFLRASSNPDALVPRAHSIVASVDASLTFDGLMPLDEIWSPVLRSERFFLSVLVVVSAVALVLSLAGIYALMSFIVAQRAREIAIRAALGARTPRIVASIFFRALAQVGLGVLAGALLVSLTIIETAKGAGLVATVAAVMILVTLLACAIPAMRALRIQPAEVLRESG